MAVMMAPVRCRGTPVEKHFESTQYVTDAHIYRNMA